MDWEDLKVFIRTVESGSLSAAAVELDLSTATVGRRIESLEGELGMQLLIRAPSGTRTTSAGARVHAMAADAARSMHNVERIAASLREGLDAEPVSISCTEPIAADILAPAMPMLRQRHPALRVEIEIATANVSLAERHAELAIRLARPTADNLVARRLKPISLGLYAAPNYLAGRAPESLDLADETILGWSRNYRGLPENQWFAERDLMQAMVMRSGSAHTLLNATAYGCGIAILPDYLARPAGLVSIPARGIPVRRPYLVFHRDMRKVERIVAVRQWVVDAFERLL